MSTRTVAAVRRTPSTRTSRAQAREALWKDEVSSFGLENDDKQIRIENFGSSVRREAAEENAIKSKGSRSQPRRHKQLDGVKGSSSCESDRASRISSVPAFISGSPMGPPLSPSKSAANCQRLPLSPMKRCNGNPSTSNSGFSPPKIVKNEENVASLRKGFTVSTTAPRPPQSPIKAGPPQSPLRAGPPQSPIRAGPPQSPIRAGPQSPLRSIRSPCGKKADSPAVTPRSLFSVSSKSASTTSSGVSKPLRTSCHPNSPFKSPPSLHLAHSVRQNSTSSTSSVSSSSSASSSSSSPLKSLQSVKRNDLFTDKPRVSKENPSADRQGKISPTSATRSQSPTSSSTGGVEAASKLVLSPRTPTSSSRIAESSSPSKPNTSPGKPAPSKAVTPASPTSKAGLTGASSGAPSSPPTSPAESRLSRLNLNAAPSPYAEARKAFHTATPAGQLKGREAERKEILDFIEEHVKETKSGALYVSGAPGTGKTATLNTIVKHYKEATKCTTIYINCMSVRNSSLIYAKILAEGSLSKTSSTPKGGAKGAQKAVEKLITSKGKPLLLFLDEMDQLGDANNQDVLYTLFEWTFTAGSRLVLVGVANALDLTERILPRLQAKAQRKPRTMNFAPYSQGQLMDILSDRLSTSSADSSPAPSLVDKSALLFCSKKIAAVSGDARKALDACRYAIEMVEKSSTESTPASTPLSTPTSSVPSTPSSVPKKVGITHVMRVLSGVYENAAVATPAGAAASAGPTSGGGTLTLQQKIIICCLVLINKKGKNKKGVTVGNLQDVYKKVCQRKGFIPGMSEAGGSDQGEFLSILSNIEASGILTIKKEKVSRDSKVNLSLDEKELEKALQDDRKLLATILQSDII